MNAQEQAMMQQDLDSLRDEPFLDLTMKQRAAMEAMRQAAAPALPLAAPVTDDDLFEYCDTHPGSSFFDAVVALTKDDGRAAGVEAEPVAQWQKKHPYRTDGRWQNTDEHDARWWVTNSMGWEMRALYAAPQPVVLRPMTILQVNSMINNMGVYDGNYEDAIVRATEKHHGTGRVQS